MSTRVRMAAAGIAVAAALAAGCSAGGPDEGAAYSRVLTVPALWAARDGSSGIENAQVAVGTGGDPGFHVDLADQQAQGAGPMWMAASAEAATVATIWSGQDPTELDIRYQVTGPIDGPSAGGILAAGTLAALRGDSFAPQVTMTGTIGPDGTIGPVGGIADKIRAAAEAGYTTMLVPQLSLQDPSKAAALQKAAAAQGVALRPVRTLVEAYGALTGVQLDAATCTTDVSPSLERAALAAPLDPRAELPAAPTPEWFARQADSAARAEDQTEAAIQAALVRTGAEAGRDQLAAVPALAAPGLRAKALAQAASEWAAEHPDDAAGLQEAANLVSFAQLTAAGQPRQLAAWLALTPDKTTSKAAVIRTADAYSTLLSQAASAQADYVQTVLARGTAASASSPDIAIALRAGELLAPASTGASASTTALDALVGLAKSMAAWTLSYQEHSVAGAPFGLGDAQLSASTAAHLAQAAACRASAAGLDPAWPTWSATTAVQGAMRAAPEDQAAAWLDASAATAAAQLALALQSARPS